MDAMDRTYLLLKPMATGAGGFARLERHADRTLIQWQGKGLRVRAARVFACDGAGAARELGVCAVDAHGQASLVAELSSRQGVSRVSAILAVSDEAAPKPLLLGVRQSGAGALLEARNAMLSLCARLGGRGAGEAKREAPIAPESREIVSEPMAEVEADPSPPAPDPLAEMLAETSGDAPSSGVSQAIQPQPAIPTTPAPAMAAALTLPPARFADEPTAEVFLPAIDPAVYVQAVQPSADDDRVRAARTVAREPVLRRDAPLLAPPDRPPSAVLPMSARLAPPRIPPLDRPRPLRWPQAVRGLSAYFDAGKPFAPFDAPGWRFVRVPMGDAFFAVGRRCRDGEVREVLYAVPGARNQPPPRELRGYRFIKAPDGQGYWVCRQAVSG